VLGGVTLNGDKDLCGCFVFAVCPNESFGFLVIDTSVFGCESFDKMHIFFLAPFSDDS